MGVSITALQIRRWADPANAVQTMGLSHYRPVILLLRRLSEAALARAWHCSIRAAGSCVTIAIRPLLSLSLSHSLTLHKPPHRPATCRPSLPSFYQAWTELGKLTKPGSGHALYRVRVEKAEAKFLTAVLCVHTRARARYPSGAVSQRRGFPVTRWCNCLSAEP